jgi:hypothetical protein
LFKKGGVAQAEAQRILKEKGFMGKDEDFWEMLSDPRNLKRKRVFAEAVFTEEQKKQVERELEEPPKGEYVTIHGERPV